MHRFKAFIHRILPSLCADCKIKIKRKYGLVTRVKHRVSRKRSRKSTGRKLRPGIHRVSIRGRMRKVKVLANGRWRFMKG